MQSATPNHSTTSQETKFSSSFSFFFSLSAKLVGHHQLLSPLVFKLVDCFNYLLIVQFASEHLPRYSFPPAAHCLRFLVPSYHSNPSIIPGHFSASLMPQF